MKKSAFDISHQQQDTGSKIVVSLERLSEAFRVLLWEHAKVLDLSPIQIQLLIFVAYHDASLCGVSHLATEFNLTKPTISDAVRVLAKERLIDKITSDVDKRAYSIALTDAGNKIVSQTEHFANPIQAIIDSLLDPAAQVNLFDSLSKIMYGLNQAGILSVQRTCYGCRHLGKTGNTSHCKLMNMTLKPADIRIDCPEFETA